MTWAIFSFIFQPNSATLFTDVCAIALVSLLQSVNFLDNFLPKLKEVFLGGCAQTLFAVTHSLIAREEALHAVFSARKMLVQDLPEFGGSLGGMKRQTLPFRHLCYTTKHSPHPFGKGRTSAGKTCLGGELLRSSLPL